MTTERGHNSGDTILNKDAQGQLKGYLTSIESIIDDALEPAKADIKAVYDSAKAAGFSTKQLRKLVALRAKDKAKVIEENAVLALYASALGCEDLV